MVGAVFTVGFWWRLQMTVLLLGLLLAAIFAFAGPTLLPQQARGPLADTSLSKP